MRKPQVLILALAFLFASLSCSSEATDHAAVDYRKLPVKGMVTLVDLGAGQCIPCKMMAPILVELEREYKGRAAIVFVDVRKNPAAARRFEIRAIPTQIFYDAQGREILRHEGFLDKDRIKLALRKCGVKPQ